MKNFYLWRKRFSLFFFYSFRCVALRVSSNCLSFVNTDQINWNCARLQIEWECFIERAISLNIESLYCHLLWWHKTIVHLKRTKRSTFDWHKSERNTKIGSEIKGERKKKKIKKEFRKKKKNIFLAKGKQKKKAFSSTFKFHTIKIQ